MHTVTVRVTNGRLQIDKPTDLPEGAKMGVIAIDDDLMAEGRAELHAPLDRALSDADAGCGVDAWDYLKQPQQSKL